MPAIFLHGGGDHAESRSNTFGRFARALRVEQPGPLALVVAEATDDDRAASFQDYSVIFQAAGVDAGQIAPLFVAPIQPLTYSALAEMRPAGVFVCGGATPLYHQALCADPGWVAYLHDTGIPYGGTSAGAAIAAKDAILGGWRARRGGQERAMLFQGASEGLDELTVRPGLGLAPFAIDVHASQWGTLLRLVHAVDLGVVAEGWALDEDTLLEIADRSLRLYGRGHAYYVKRTDTGDTTVAIYTAPLELHARSR
jgi:cyanophycinase